MADKNSTLSLELLNELFYYQDGFLFRKKSTQKNVFVGSKVGTVNTLGYSVVSIKNKTYLIHRLIYWMLHGYCPKYVDHIDGNKLNNKIENLRSATNQQNIFNQKIKKGSRSGYKNVIWDKRIKKWCVRFTINYKTKYIGLYTNLEKAIEVAKETRAKLHGDFARDF